MIKKIIKILQLFFILSSITLSNAEDVTEEELESFSYGRSQFKLAIVGDTGPVKAAAEVMKLTSFDALLHLGDFDYDCHPDAYFDKILSSSRKYKFMGVLGNHDSSSECTESVAKRFRDNIYKEMKSTSKNSGVECKFSDSKYMWSCRYHNLRIIGLTPDIKGTDDRSKQLRFLKDELSKSTEDWKICAWHYYDKYYHTGKYPDDGNLVSGDGESFYDYCREHGAIIFSAHDHVYARTKVMSKFSSHEIDRYDDRTGSHIVQIRDGATLNILNGAGGYEIYEEKGKQKDYPHWQKKYALGDHHENENKFGGLFCTFNVGGNKKKAYCEFQRINSSDKLFDYFTIYQNDNPSSVRYSDIDEKFKNEKLKAYKAEKGITDKPVETPRASNNTDTNTNTSYNNFNNTNTSNTSTNSTSFNNTNTNNNTLPINNANTNMNTAPYSRPIVPVPVIDANSNSNINKVESENSSNKPLTEYIFSKTGITIGATTCALIAVVTIMAIKSKNNAKRILKEQELVSKTTREEIDQRNPLSPRESQPVLVENNDFVVLPVPNYNNNYQMQAGHFKYN